jgi:hypothetical protein
MNTYKFIAIALLIGNVSFGQTLKDAVQKTENERFSDNQLDKSLLLL